MSVACFVLIATLSGGTTPRYAPTPGEAVRKEVAGGHVLELEEMTVRMGGREVPAEYLPELDMRIESRRALTVVDRVLAVADGRPSELLRTFEEIEARGDQHVAVAGFSDETAGADGTSELAGETVRFEWDAEAESYDRSFPEGGDEALLDGLEEDLDLRGFLPADEVEVGDTWQVEGERLTALFLPGGDLSLEWNAEGDWAQGSDGEVTGSLDVRLAEVADGVARLVVEGTLESVTVEETDLSQVPVADGAASQRSTATWEVAGTVRWDLALGRARGADFTADMGLVIEIDKLESEPGPSYSQTLVLAGEWELSFSFEPAE